MAKTAAEYQRAYRERKKAKEKAERDGVRPVKEIIQKGAKRSFSEFYIEHKATLTHPESLDWVGVTIHADLADELPSLEKADLWLEQGLEVNSLSVALAQMEVFLDAAKELADLINKYLIEEIDQQMPNSSPAKAKQLGALRMRLAKKTSHFFPVID